MSSCGWRKKYTDAVALGTGLRLVGILHCTQYLCLVPSCPMYLIQCFQLGSTTQFYEEGKDILYFCNQYEWSYEPECMSLSPLLLFVG